MDVVSCLLCRSSAITSLGMIEAKTYFWCQACDCRFLDPKFRLNAEDEKARYRTHNNDVTDVRYQNFVRPLFEVLKNNVSATAEGLDFGAGEGPVLTRMLEQSGHRVSLYDPLFWPDQTALARLYDYIFACEVIEHFYDPRLEFERLKGLLKPRGILAFMTHFYSDEIDFASWYYRRDPTHVVFYTQKTFYWLAAFLDLAPPEFTGSRIVLLRQ